MTYPPTASPIRLRARYPMWLLAWRGAAVLVCLVGAMSERSKGHLTDFLNKEKYMKQVRQGDVLLVAVKSAPKQATEVREKGDVILAHGEVTGHAHRLEETDKAKLLDFKAERFLQIAEKTALTHEEHSAIFLEKGTYKQAFQVEDFGEEVRRVAD